MYRQELLVSQVVKIVGCHRNTILRYERLGFITAMRDSNNFRRYPLSEAMKLKEILNSRKPMNKSSHEDKACAGG